MFRRKDNEAGDNTDASATPSSASTGPASKPAATAETGGKRLMVGQGISLSGEITACDRLIVEGNVQVTLNETKAIEIAEGGRFTNGKAEVEEAVISGVYEGELTVRGRLLIRASGRVNGTIRYRELEIECGGKIGGSLHALDAPPTKPSTSPASPPLPTRNTSAQAAASPTTISSPTSSPA